MAVVVAGLALVDVPAFVQTILEIERVSTRQAFG
jgi:hypothetical protein